MKKAGFLYSLFVLLFFFLTLFAMDEGVTNENKNAEPQNDSLKKVYEMKMKIAKYSHIILDDLCAACHTGRKDRLGRIIPESFRLIEDVPQLCYECHEKQTDDEYYHPPYDEGDCLTCHNPHASNYKHMLLKPLNKLCTECHDVTQEGVIYFHEVKADESCNMCHKPHGGDHEHLLKSEPPDLCYQCHFKSREFEEVENVHPPFEEDCFNCHNQHGSIERHLLNEPMPDLCVNCHSDVAGEDAPKTSVHGALTSGEKCANCHSPHFSSHSSLLLQEKESLCVSCHNKPMGAPPNEVEDIEHKIENSDYVHPPIEEGCESCHVPHTSEYPHILNNSFPAGNYAKGTEGQYGLCFNCHDQSMIEEQISDEVTEFRKGHQNLHYVHVKQYAKSRACINCHDVHGSNMEHQLKDKIPFGLWKMPLNFQPLDDGGKCSPACHEPREYHR